RGGAGGGGCGGPALGVLVLGFEGSAYAGANAFRYPDDAALGGPGGNGAAGLARTRGVDGGSRRVLEIIPCGPGGACPVGTACDPSGSCLPGEGGRP
ncbi:MAG TPA: hypothetical protein RMF84_18635, partial [Polyangiaceae bacterium LLY-WYZ-14_1]|nr:hypothetical protein [Polyangiaceae bacterium LLY-WYZ-14_1]